MRIIYKLNEEDIKKILADHFEALPEEVKFSHMVSNNLEGDTEVQTVIEIDTIQE